MKKKFDGSYGPENNKNKFSKPNFNNNKYGSNQELKWCDMYKKKHWGDCVICFKCKNTGHISSNFPIKRRVCFNYGEEGYMKSECPKADKPTMKILQAKPKGESYQMTLNKAKETTGVASGIFLVNQFLPKFYLI